MKSRRWSHTTQSGPCYTRPSARDRLVDLFPDQFLDVQHFGSTAVPGMPAKPIIDLLAGVGSMAIADSLVEPLLKSGYTTSAEFNSTLNDRRWFMRWAEGRRTHHLHLVVLGGSEWRRRLRFRDLLRADPELAHRYALLKKELAANTAKIGKPTPALSRNSFSPSQGTRRVSALRAFALLGNL